jgi:uncharacterized membrane protein YhaH (DUF805 family)
MDWTVYLFGFEGRINRAKMWLAGLIVLCWMLLLAGLAVAAGIVSGGNGESFGFDIDDVFRVVDPASWRSLSRDYFPTLLVKVAGTSLFVWVYFATAIKRLHDRDRSGFWMVPFFVVPGLHNQFAGRLPDSPFDLPLALIAFALCIWGFVEMYCLKGSPKTNRFGPDPLVRPDTRPRWEQAREIEMVPHKASPPPVWHVKRNA